jgi:hypothetical protein
VRFSSDARMKRAQLKDVSGPEGVSVTVEVSDTSRMKGSELKDVSGPEGGGSDCGSVRHQLIS